jgi:hypothetical protein
MTFRINLINHKTLTFALLLILALTFVFSLRPVRLKIGDYYYNRGKVDQAVNWYEPSKRHKLCKP